MFKSESLAIVNTLLAVLTLVSNGISLFVVPQHHIASVYLATLIMYGTIHVIDMKNSDALSRNVEVMRRSGGLSELEIWGSAVLVYFGFQLPSIVIVLYVLEYNAQWEVPTLSNAYFGADKILGAVIAVLATDACFFLMHRFLHEQLPRLHLLHHCCLNSSLTTNLFFNPLDLAMEFSAPVGTLAAVAKFGFPTCQSWMFCLSLSILQTWYVLGHDEWLSWDHVRHHRTVGTGYFIYNNYFYQDHGKEMVRTLIKDSSLPQMKRERQESTRLVDKKNR